MNLERLAATAPRGEPGTPTTAIIWGLRRLARPWVRIAFRPSLTGAENLPSDRAYMLVANHGAGVAVADLLSFAVLWAERFGRARRIAGFAHPFAFHVWPVSRLMPALGCVPSSFAAGLDVLTSGIPIVIFPGGDHEASQSVMRGNAVDFGGRTGFIKLAREANVTIVPMGIRGGHFTAPILFRSRAFAWLAIMPRLFGVKRYPVSVAAVIGAVAIVLLGGGLGWLRFLLAFLWMTSPLSLLPWVPWTIRFRIGAPIEQDELGGDIFHARDRVESAVAELVARA